MCTLSCTLFLDNSDPSCIPREKMKNMGILDAVRETTEAKMNSKISEGIHIIKQHTHKSNGDEQVHSRP
jgi:hypothetical protein